MDRMDRRQLDMLPLSARKHKLVMEQIAVRAGDAHEALPDATKEQVERTAAKLKSARKAGSARMLTYGAHLIKNGAAPVIIKLIEEGWLTHVATNGAGSIHDWEFAYLGKSTEDVRANTAHGCFGTWEETGRYINLAVAVGGVDDLGYGASVGRMIAENGLTIPSAGELREQIRAASAEPVATERLGALADLLYMVTTFDLPAGRTEIQHPYPEYSVQHSAYTHGIPLTIHPGIGYDIIYTHPMNCGGAIGRASVRDFLSYADSVSKLSDGIHITVGSAIMAPMVFEKSMSIANNLWLKTKGTTVSGHDIVVVDIQDGGGWDWSHGEPPMDNPAYYLRFCKTFYRMGGTLDYVCLDNIQFMLALYEELQG